MYTLMFPETCFTKKFNTHQCICIYHLLIARSLYDTNKRSYHLYLHRSHLNNFRCLFHIHLYLDNKENEKKKKHIIMEGDENIKQVPLIFATFLPAFSSLNGNLFIKGDDDVFL